MFWVFHCKKYRNFTRFPGVETVPFRKISTPDNQVKLRYFSQCSFLFLNFNFDQNANDLYRKSKKNQGYEVNPYMVFAKKFHFCPTIKLLTTFMDLKNRSTNHRIKCQYERCLRLIFYIRKPHFTKSYFNSLNESLFIQHKAPAAEMFRNINDFQKWEYLFL